MINHVQHQRFHIMYYNSVQFCHYLVLYHSVYLITCFACLNLEKCLCGYKLKAWLDSITLNPAAVSYCGHKCLNIINILCTATWQ